MPATRAERWRARLAFLRAPLRLSLALLWIMTGLLSLGLYPAADSYALLAEAGIVGWPAPLMLYGAALWDLALGLALLLRIRPRLAGAAQIATMLVYTLIITLRLPELWLHPFGPVSKNLPLIMATLIMIALDDR